MRGKIAFLWIIIGVLACGYYLWLNYGKLQEFQDKAGELSEPPFAEQTKA